MFLLRIAIAHEIKQHISMSSANQEIEKLDKITAINETKRNNKMAMMMIK